MDQEGHCIPYPILKIEDLASQPKSLSTLLEFVHYEKLNPPMQVIIMNRLGKAVNVEEGAQTDSLQ
jgi:hypothetical protein